MTHRQAKRRNSGRAKKAAMPRLSLARLGAYALAVGIVTLSYRTSTALLDRPITALTIDGPFQRVTALQIEESISDVLDKGFLSADLDEIRQRIVALAWIDTASVVRRWPGRLEIRVSEQVPAACWGEDGLLNTRGELFVTGARHIPAELPRLSGPDGRSAEVAERYLTMRRRLIPRGLDLRRVHVDERGAWEMTLQNGIEVRLGRRDVPARGELFVDVVATLITRRAADIDFVDMRYGNGFSIGWHRDASATSAAAPAMPAAEMLAGPAE